ncbi:hypothetical protein [Methanosarcina spelaei]|nr:hypothetical protein [Methanosarcina spelaei]
MLSNENYRKLEEKAKELGAKSVRLLPAEDIVVEDRTVSMCPSC